MAARRNPTQAHACAGFTLIEMVMVMVITAILAIGTVKFIDGPVQGYVEANVRAELTDIADTALRRIGRDVRAALPNSVRKTDDGLFVEFLNTTTGGMYQTNDACFTTGATGGCDHLVSLGSVVPEASLALTDFVVINNFSNNSPDICDSASPNCSAYCSDSLKTGFNKALVTGTTDSTNADAISFAKTKFCPAAVENSRRFQVIDGPVSYACDLTAHTLTRYWGYSIQQAQTSVDSVNKLIALTTADHRSILATNVSSCTFALYPNSGLLALRLALTHTTTPFETVNLYHEIHVSTSP